MSKLLSTIAGLLLALSPTAALASSASIILSLRVPVSCSVDVVGGSIVGNRVNVRVQRTCNTSHEIVVESAVEDAGGAVTMNYNGTTYSLASDDYLLAQPEAYYDQVDTVAFDVAGTPEQVQQFAASVHFGVNAA